MDFTLNDEERLFKQVVADFVDREIPKEQVRTWEEQGVFPLHLWHKWADLGWLGMAFPEEYGGTDTGPVLLALLCEGLGRRGYEISLGYSLPVFTGLTLLKHGSEAQRRTLLPALIRGDVRFSISITEPDVGSDAASLATRAVLVGDEWVITGHKVFSSGAHLPNNLILVACRTDPTAPRHRGISVILVPNDTPGVEIQRMRTLGRHIFATTEIHFHDVRVPAANLVGPLNGGWSLLTSHLEWERLLISAGYVGNGQTVVDDAVNYARQRTQFGQPISKFQAIAHMLVDMQVDVDAARLMVYNCASLIAKGVACFKEVSMTKLFAAEMLARITNSGMQVMGGYGYTKDFDMERYFRTARVTTIVGGTSQIQRNIIARQMGL